MARKKKERKEPTIPLVVGLGIVTCLLGASLALFSLASQAATEVSRMPEPEKRIPRAVYFIKGDEGRAANWQAKWNAVQGEELPSAVSIRESDLNAWSRRHLDPDKPETIGTFTLIPGNVNFRFTGDGLLQIGVPVEAAGLFPGKAPVFQLQGRLSTRGGKIVFSPVSGFLGKSPIGYVPVLNRFSYRVVRSLFEGTEGAEGLLGGASIGAATIEDNRLVLRPAS